MTNPFLRLRCDLQIAPYGKKGSSSIAAHYATATPENEFTIDENVNYGEVRSKVLFVILFCLFCQELN